MREGLDGAEEETFPIQDREADVVGTSSEEREGAARVLIADDDLVLRVRLESLLSREESVELVGVAVDTDGAIALAEEHRPDAVLLDVDMPGGGAAHAIPEIVRGSPETAIVILSALDERNLVIGLLEAGAMSYVVKGAPADELVDTIHRSIASHETDRSN